jgi:chitin disaccharide deacetylase
MLTKYLKYLFVCSIILSASAGRSAEPSTYAEKLGWPAGTKAVILHVDNKGQGQGWNLGSIKALEEGLATSMAIMINRPAGPEIVEYVKAHPQVDVGLHLDPTLNAGADKIESDIRAEIDKAISIGVKPTHVDSEGASHLRGAQYINSFVKVAIEKKIPLLFYGGHMQYIGTEAGANKQLFLSIAAKLWNAGLPVIDDVIAHRSHSSDYEERNANLKTLLQEMKPGITEVIFHCSIKTDDSKTDNPSVSSGPGSQDMGMEGEMDVRLLTDPDIKAFIKSEGIVLTTWRELMKRRAQVKN